MSEVPNCRCNPLLQLYDWSQTGFFFFLFERPSQFLTDVLRHIMRLGKNCTPSRLKHDAKRISGYKLSREGQQCSPSWSYQNTHLIRCIGRELVNFESEKCLQWYQRTSAPTVSLAVKQTVLCHLKALYSTTVVSCHNKWRSTKGSSSSSYGTQSQPT